MPNWLERAKQEIPAGTDGATAKAAGRNLSAVVAVPQPAEPDISRSSIDSNGSAPAADCPETEAVVPLTDSDERILRAWLSHIDERDETIADHMLDRCRSDADARAYFLLRAGEVPPPDALDDDRRRCNQCANLMERRLCLAARRSEIVASRSYEPMRNLLRRCEAYVPRPDDLDRRPGLERWPGLTQKGSNDADA